METAESMPKTAFRQTLQKSAPAIILLAAASIISLSTVSALYNTVRFFPTGNAAGEYTVTVEQARMLQYSTEVIVRFDQNSGIAMPHGGDGVRAIVFLPSTADVQKGDLARYRGELRPITPGQCAQSDFHRTLIRSGISIVLYADDNSFSIVRRGGSLPASMRCAVERNIDRLFYAETAAMLKSLYFGNCNFLDKQMIMDFKKAGVLHILAASGFNVAAVAAIPFFLLAPLRVRRGVITAVTLACISLYLIITDMPVSLLRAFIMFTAYAIQRACDMDRSIMNSLYIAATILLAVFPHELYALGFQLSFGATAGIILWFARYKESLPAMPAFFRNSFALTLSAQAAVLPVLAYRVHEVNLIGLLSNLVVVPASSMTFVLSIFANGISVISSALAFPLVRATDVLNEITILCVHLLSGLNGNFRFTGIPLPLYPACALYLLPLLVAPRFRKYGCVSLIASMAITWAAVADNTSGAEKTISLKAGASEISAVVRQRHALVFGDLQSRDDARALVDILAFRNIETAQICLVSTGYTNISCYTQVMKKVIVTECLLDSEFRFSPALSRLMSLLERDGINLRIVPLQIFRRPDGGGIDASLAGALFSYPGDTPLFARRVQATGAATRFPCIRALYQWISELLFS